MKSLVVLNECGFSSEQINFLKTNFADFSFYTDTLSEDQAIERIQNRNIIIMDQFIWPISEKLFKNCKNLELIILNTTAYDRIPADLLKKYNVKLSNLKTYATKDVAEVAVSMMMYLNCNLDLARKTVLEEKLEIDKYKQSEIIRDIYPGHPIIPYLKRYPISTQTAGIVGLGNIGQSILNLCKKLGMNTIAYNRSPKNAAGVKMVTLESLFKESDVIFIALKYDQSTMTNLVSEDLMELSKKDAILISISPSEIVEIDYLIKNKDRFRGLGFDYFVTDKLIELTKVGRDNLIVTPHLGHQSYRAYSNLTSSIIDSAVGFSKKKDQ